MKYHLISLMMIFGLFLGGCGSVESVGYFLGGLKTGIQLAEKTTEELNKATADANDLQIKIKEASNSAKSILAIADPNDIALIAELIKSDPNSIENIITGVIEIYNNTHGAIATVKEKSREPSYWVALLLGMTAAYQKYRRIKS